MPMSKVEDETNTMNSDAVLVPFAAKWEAQLKNNAISAVIRKRVPKDNRYRLLYMYMNSPVSAICFRATIQRVYHATRDEALSLHRELGLSSDAIADYLKESPEVGCYILRDVQHAKSAVSLAQLAAKFNIHPPQGFLILSPTVALAIDELADFSDTKSQDEEENK